MMKFILIIMTFSGSILDRPNYVASVEFNSWPACIEAMNRIEKREKSVKAICVPKGKLNVQKQKGSDDAN